MAPGDLRLSELTCCVCKKPIPEKEKEYAELPENHPGVLGPIHPACYDKLVTACPDLPWTDPITGEINYDEMAEDLGVDGDGYEDEDEGDEEEWT